MEVCDFVPEEKYKDYYNYETPFHYLAKLDQDTYSDDKKNKIRVIYLIAVIVWLIIIFIFEFYKTTVVGYFILFIPIFLFAISFFFVENGTVEFESEVLGGNYIAFLFLIISVIIRWSKIKQKRKIILALMVSIFLIMFSLIDVWVGKSNLILLKHIRTIFNTAALALLIYALYENYSEMLQEGGFEEDPQSGTDLSGDVNEDVDGAEGLEELELEELAEI
uniref:Uncharacterized protein n=1 Tax=Pithovirus LCPAC001 TaxID=2506585 RepID=A0A481Z3Q1_9VIRU|nr:MAG: hypothetical protein LCPAC001_01090 [Pithovirus LCPAC001]